MTNLYVEKFLQIPTEHSKVFTQLLFLKNLHVLKHGIYNVQVVTKTGHFKKF